MPVMEKLKMFVVQEPVVAASCLIAGVGKFFSIFIIDLAQPSNLISVWMFVLFFNNQLNTSMNVYTFPFVIILSLYLIDSVKIEKIMMICLIL